VALKGRGIGIPRMAVFLQTDERERRLDGQAHNLGNVTVGRPVSTLIYLGNSGTAGLDVSNLDGAGGGFRVDSELAAVPKPGVGGVGVSATYVGALRFAPAQQGAHTGTLTIHSNDADGAEFTVPLRANAVLSELDIRVDGEQINPGNGFSGEYDFGEVLVGESVTKKIIINKPTTPLVTIRFIYLADDGGGQFDVVRPTLPSYPWSRNNTSLTATLSFAPTQPGSAAAVLVIRQGGSRILSMLTFRAAGVAPQMSVGMVGQTARLDTDGYDFGAVSADAGAATTVTVSNNGGGDLKISSIRVAGAGYRLGGGDSGVIAADSSANWVVHFTPPGDAPSYRGVLTIVSNDRESGPQGVWTLELSGGAQDAANFAGTSTEPRMTVAIDGAPCDENCRHDFGETALASTTDIVQVVVSNTGAVKLDISSIGVTGDGYSLVNADVPQTVVPGGLTTFSLRFSPTLAETLTGVLSIAGDPRQPRWSASVTGHGKGPRLALKHDGRYISDNELLTGDYPDGQDDTRYRLQIENSGDEDLIIESYSREGCSMLFHLGKMIPERISP